MYNETNYCSRDGKRRMKLIKCRQTTTCDTCRGEINKGDLYRKLRFAVSEDPEGPCIDSLTILAMKKVVKLCKGCANTEYSQ